MNIQDSEAFPVKTSNFQTLNFSFTSGTYTVSRTTFVSPGPSGAADGSQGAFVTFAPASAVPEPGVVASLGMGALGLAGLMLIRRRKMQTLA